MKKAIHMFLIAGFIVSFFISCEKEEGIETYNAEIQIDSLHQETIQFGMNLIPGNLHVYYSVVNNDFADIHSYVFTIKAMNVDSVSYNFIERSNNGVPGNSIKTGVAIMGIGGKSFLEAKLEGETFE